MVRKQTHRSDLHSFRMIPQSDRIIIPPLPKLKGRKSMRGLSRDAVTRAMQQQDGMQALKFLHPRRLREAILHKQIPDGTFKPTE